MKHLTVAPSNTERSADSMMGAITTWARNDPAKAAGLAAAAVIVPIALTQGSGGLGVALPILFLVVYIAAANFIGKAAARKGRSETAWSLIAFFFGLVLPAIIVACMVDTDRRQTEAAASANPQVELDSDAVTCPFCAENIKAAAIKCKHCASDLSDVKAK